MTQSHIQTDAIKRAHEDLKIRLVIFFLNNNWISLELITKIFYQISLDDKRILINRGSINIIIKIV